MSPGRAAILTALGVPVVVEWYGVRHPGEGFTVSELIRWGFRTGTRPGRVVFCVSVVAGVAWLLPHICRGARSVSAAVSE